MSPRSPKPAVAPLPTLGSIRDGFGIGLTEAATADENIVGLCADVTESVRMNLFQSAFPDRFIEVGVAEQNLIGVAAGLALGGKIPFAASYATFSPGRSWEQIRVAVCYSNLNVKIVGGHAGLTVGPDGATHQALEDIALMRVLPQMTVVVPCDQEEARRATLAIAEHVGPTYLRLCRDKVPTVTTQSSPFKLGKAVILRPGTSVTIVACGIMVYAALQAAEQLALEGISAQVINVHTIKPIDKFTLVTAARATGAVVTAEEHQVMGGLGSAVAEVLAETCPVPMERVGVKDVFGESGDSPDLLRKYGLTSGSIVKAVWKVLARKRRL